MAGHKVRKGRGGRSGEPRKSGSRGMSTPPSSSGKALYCEKCCQTGVHHTVAQVRECYGRGVVMGRDFRWVRPL